MAQTKIEWTQRSWNPTVGCDKVSAGCAGCYAVRMAFRLQNMGQTDYNGLTVLQDNGKRNWTGEVRTLPKRLVEPLKWKKPVRVFVNSMSDLFHEDVPFEFVDQVFAVMMLAKQHTFQVLTKRPERMAEYFARPHLQAEIKAIAFVKALRGLVKNPEDFRHYYPWPLPNVWLGASVEDQKAADERIPHLLQVPAAVRFLSCEPLLGPVKLQRWIGYASYEGNIPGHCVNIDGETWHKDDYKCRSCGWGYPNDPDYPRRVPGIDWVIVGGESGPGARPMHPDWARSLRDQCKDAGVPFFFKQWGEYVAKRLHEPTPKCTGNNWGVLDINGNYYATGTPWNGREGKASDLGEYTMVRIGKREAGRLLDGVEYSQFPSTEAIR